jgi:lysophospholipase L1-like esterase
MIGCGAQQGSAAERLERQEPVRILALGDSYTIGEGVAAEERWSAQWAALLEGRGVQVAELHVIARTGWTSADLTAALEREEPAGPFDLVSLLIGVNNQYRGRDLEEYRAEFRELLGRAIAYAGGDARRVVVLSIPDWGVTPYAEGRDRAKVAAEIDRFNEVNREEAEAAGAQYVDVTPLSRSAAHDPSLLAADGLHPSGKMYALWAELALPAALDALRGDGH